MVISVIAILTTLLMANFVGIRQRGRDGQRKSNLYNMQSALELYRADVGAYPESGAFPGCGQQLANGDAIYMQEVPCDPTGDEVDYDYESLDGISYIIIACLENENDSDRDDADMYAQSNCDTPASFTLTNP